MSFTIPHNPPLRASVPSLPPVVVKTESGTEEFPCQFQGFLDWQRGGRCRFLHPSIDFSGSLLILRAKFIASNFPSTLWIGLILFEMGGNGQKYAKIPREDVCRWTHLLWIPRLSCLLSTALHKHRCPTKTLEIHHKTQPENRMICVFNNITIRSVLCLSY